MTNQPSVAGVVGIILIVLLLIPAVWAFSTWIAMLLWNWIVGDVFGWKTLTFWQTGGLLILLGILTAGFRATISKS